jgi:predicted transcriptional regulator
MAKHTHQSAKQNEDVQLLQERISAAPITQGLAQRLFHSKPFEMPNEISRVVSSFLPAYAFHRLPEVNKRWYKEGLENPLFKPTIKEIVNSCKTPQDVINILQDANLRDQLTIRELLTVIAVYPQLADAMVTKYCKEILSLEAPQLFFVPLASQSEMVALNIYNYVKSLPSRERNLQNVFPLAKTSKNVAMVILKDALNSDCMTGHRTIEIAGMHEETATYIYDDIYQKSQSSKIRIKEIVQLANMNESIAVRILNDKKMCKKIPDPSFYLWRYPHLGDIVLNNPILRNKIDLNRVIQIIAQECKKEGLTLVKTLLKDKSLDLTIPSAALRKMAQIDKEIYEILRADVKLFLQINTEDVYHLRARWNNWDINKTDNIQSLDQPSLYMLALCNESNALSILNNEQLRHKLSSAQIDEIGNKYSKAALAIIDFELNKIKQEFSHQPHAQFDGRYYDILCKFSYHEDVASRLVDYINQQEKYIMQEKEKGRLVVVRRLQDEIISNIIKFPKVCAKILKVQGLFYHPVSRMIFANRRLAHEVFRQSPKIFPSITEYECDPFLSLRTIKAILDISRNRTRSKISKKAMGDAQLGISILEYAIAFVKNTNEHESSPKKSQLTMR